MSNTMPDKDQDKENADPAKKDRQERQRTKNQEDAAILKKMDAELSRITEHRYEIQSFLGRGSYGVVVAALDNTTCEKVAIKRIYPDVLCNPFLGTRVVREIKLLAHFDHPNIIGIQNLFCRDTPGKETAYMMMDVMDMDLSGLLRSNQTLSEQHVQFFMAQILSALQFIHEAGVIHRDLTPSNCLLNINCDLRICDFGLAREAELEMTDYVVMRWYRAPELLMQLPHYDSSVDMWAAGCILAQMLHKGVPVFKGTSTLNQLEKIMDVVGTPTEETVAAMGGSVNAQLLCRKRGPRKPLDYLEIFTGPAGGPPSEDCLSLLSSVWDFDPRRRISAKEALCHKYVSSCGYEVPNLPPIAQFQFASEKELDIHEVLAELKKVQRQKGWGDLEDEPMERLASNLSSRDLAASLSFLQRTASDARTALQDTEGRHRSFQIPNAKQVEECNSPTSPHSNSTTSYGSSNMDSPQTFSCIPSMDTTTTSPPQQIDVYESPTMDSAP